MQATDYYAQYAPFYDDEDTSSDSTDKAAFLEKILHKRAPHAKSILEIACGTGNILKPLSTQYDVAGLDLSSKMLEMARKKLPNTPFYEGDMVNFKLHKKFDVILCIFDSINHLTHFDQWEATFDSVKAHINDGGVFIVDINTIYKMERFAAFRPIYEIRKGNYHLINIEKQHSGLYNWNIDVFTPTEGTATMYKLRHTSIPIAAYPYEQVEQSLKVRFNQVQTHTPDGEPISDTTDRIYFSCKA